MLNLFLKSRPALLICATIALALATNALAGDLHEHTLAPGTPHATPYTIQTADQPGPTVLVIGGIHGNEPAGAEAVEVVRFWPITRGKVITVPRANVTGLAPGKRAIQDAPPEQAQLNRAFPGPKDEADDVVPHPLACALWELVTTHKPDWVLDCHEGQQVDRENEYSIGNTIIADGHEGTTGLFDAMLDAVNEGTKDPAHRFVKLSGPAVPGSLVRATSEHLGARSVLMATSRKDQRLPVRARQHRQMIYAALTHLEMLAPDVTPATLLTSLEAEETVVVGIFDDSGVGGKGREKIEQDLDPRPGYRTVRFDGQDIRAGSCEGFDVLVFSGGSGTGQSNSLGDEGRDLVREFVENGGTYVGICAGGYLAGSGSKTWLGLVDVKTRSPKWERGRAQLEVELSPAGATTFEAEEERSRTILYANGPVWEAAERDDLADAEVLGWFRTEVAKNGTPEGLQVDTPALIRGTYGRGVAVAFSCHPEQTQGCEDFVFRAIEAARERAAEDLAKPAAATTP